jgi:two-component system, NarL family, response regulator
MTTPAKIRLLLCDDHDLARAGIRGVIEDEGDIEVLAEARDGVAAVALFRNHKPDVVVMDVRMPNLDGVRATNAILHEYPDAKILILSSYDTEEDVFRACEAGAAGYMLKESNAEDIVKAIRIVADGGKHLPAALAESLARRSSVPQLTVRERQILERLHEGQKNSDIAEALGLSPGTVRMYVSQILEKLGSSNRTEAVAEGLRRGILRQPRA